MKVFISMPMHGLSYENIRNRHNELADLIHSVEEYKDAEIIDSIIVDRSDNHIFNLGTSIQLMSAADIVLFADNWATARGCRSEHFICVNYGIKWITEGSLAVL